MLLLLLPKLLLLLPTLLLLLPTMLLLPTLLPSAVPCAVARPSPRGGWGGDNKLRPHLET